MNEKKVELLAPAGSYDCFIAAVNAGADAVYLGLDRFGARASAANFSADELKSALDIAHMRGVKIYLTVNTLFKDREIEDIADLLYEPYIYGLDGVIVQDIGVMSVINRAFPKLPIHVSTQAAVTNASGFEILKDLGVKRVVPARELSLDEIRRMADTGMEIECFIHGSMCYCYSGKCLMSSFIGGRSGNRGRCAQPCRLPYDDHYYLSLKDMCVIDMIPELIGAGISSFKIEGRMKDSEYVHAVTSVYRKYMDLCLSGVKYEVDPADRARLISRYTRGGNCEGYYHQHNSKDMITVDSPSYSSASDQKEEISAEAYPIPVNIKCSIRAGSEAVIDVYDDRRSITCSTGITPEPARNCMLTEESVRKQLIRSGGSGFSVTDCIVSCDPGLFLPNGKLNEIRRMGLDAFRSSIVSAFHRSGYCPDIKRTAPAFIKDNETPRINVSVLSREQLGAALSLDIDGVIIPMGMFHKDIIKEYDLRDKKIYAALPYVIRDDGRSNSSRSVETFVRQCINYPVSGLYVSNLESLAILKKMQYNGEVTADIHLYAYNQEAYEYYGKHGVTVSTVPVELNERELERRGIAGEELIVYGRLPMMISANCVYNTKFGCDRKKSGHLIYIEDRKKEKLPVLCRCDECTNIIYNCIKLDITDESMLFRKLKPSSVRFCFTDEKPDDVRSVLKKYNEHRQYDGSTDVCLIDTYTRGHIKRGVE